jgi:hypothetical protein
LFLVNVVCCQVEVSSKDRSFVRRSKSECCVSECDLGTLTRRSSGPARAVEQWGGGESVISPKSHSEMTKTYLEENININISLDE